MSKQTDASHWSRYWAAGPVTSLPQDFAGNYDGELAKFWSAHFQGLDAPSRRVLDVCTGNGAVAMLAANALPQAEIVAVDAAGIDPQQALAGRPQLLALAGRVRFVANCPVEALDESFGQFDLISSQYGFEYCDWRLGAVCLRKLLKPGAKLVLVVHSPDSAMVERMSAEFDEYQAVGRAGFCQRLREFATDPARSDMEYFRSSIRQVNDALASLQQGTDQALLASVIQAGKGLLMMSDLQIRQQAAAMAAYADELDAGSQRLADMLAVNTALLEQPDWYRLFEAEGLILQERSSLRYKGEHHCGDSFVFKKPE